MNPKSLLLSSIVGIPVGFLTLVGLRGVPGGCCTGFLAFFIGCLVGPFLAVLFYKTWVRTAANLGYGAVHGIAVSGLASLALWFGMAVFTSEDTFGQFSEKYVEWYKEQLQQAEKFQKEKNPDAPESLTEEQRESVENLLDQMKDNPGSIRMALLTICICFTLLAAPLLGMLGAFLGMLAFGNRLKKKGKPDSVDRMEVPEQPEGWWEK